VILVRTVLVILALIVFAWLIGLLLRPRTRRKRS
jgi:hypothetical protein